MARSRTGFIMSYGTPPVNSRADGNKNIYVKSRYVNMLLWHLGIFTIDIFDQHSHTQFTQRRHARVTDLVTRVHFCSASKNSCHEVSNTIKGLGLLVCAAVRKLPLILDENDVVEKFGFFFALNGVDVW